MLEESIKDGSQNRENNRRNIKNQNKVSVLLKNIIFNGKKQDIFIEESKIKKISRNLNLKARERIDGKGEKAVLPGQVNCHTHAAMILFRGYADDLPLKAWLERKIWPLEFKMTRDDVYWGMKIACLEMIKTGTTCFNDMYWFEEAAIEAVKEMGLRAKIGLILLDSLPAGRKNHIEKLYLNRKIKEPEIIQFSIAPHSIYTVSKENLIWAKNFAKKHDLLLHIHLAETKKEVKDCFKKYRLRPVEFLDGIGFLSENTVLAHSIWLSDNEIEILRKRKSSVVYNPCSNMKLASGVFPYSKINQAGINICLGTDGAASNNNLDMLEEMKFGALLQKVNEKDPAIAPTSEIFKTATENGAKALKINTGEVKEGKLADLILIDLSKIYFQPGYNFLSDIIYSASGDCVSDLICNGRILMRERRIEGEEEVIKNAVSRVKIIK